MRQLGTTALFVLTVALAATTSLSAAPAPGEASAEQTTSAALQPVDPATVCMVNDHAMGKPQIAVVVAEKTYYGCCEMCKQRLAEDAAVRFAVDPVTGEKVDKATAVIGALPDGSVLYFKSAETLKRYRPAASQ